MSDVTPLRPVPDSIPDEEKVDLWLMPNNLPLGLPVLTRPLPAQRYWSFSLEDTILSPMPSIALASLAETYQGEPLMGYPQLCWFLENQEHIPDAWRKYEIYFLGFQFVRPKWQIYTYSMRFEKDQWKRAEHDLSSCPGKHTGKIILSR